MGTVAWDRVSPLAGLLQRRLEFTPRPGGTMLPGLECPP